MICPGNYPEQVVISSPLVLKGIANGNASAAVITVPAGGLVENAISSLFSSMKVQLLIQNTKDVSVSNLTVDGSGTGTFCSDTMAGIEIYQAGQIGHANTITNMVARNGCGIGILSDTSFADIESNDIHGTGGENLYTYAGTNKIGSNTFTGTIVVQGIDSFQATGSVASGNTIPEGMMLLDIGGVTVAQNTVQSEIFLNESSNNTVTNNTAILSGGPGIELLSDCLGCSGTMNNTITENKVSGGATGVQWFNSGQNVIQNNTFTNVQSGVVIDDEPGAGGNIVKSNTVNEATCGIDIVALVNTAFTPNNLFNVVTRVCHH